LSLDGHLSKLYPAARPPSKMATVTKIRRRVWRYQMGNQNPYIEEEQITHGQKKKFKRTNNDQQNIHIKLKIE